MAAPSDHFVAAGWLWRRHPNLPATKQPLRQPFQQRQYDWTPDQVLQPVRQHLPYAESRRNAIQVERALAAYAGVA